MKPVRGFTLIELAVVIALVVVLAAIAVPSYFHLVGSNGAAAAVNALAATLSHARSEAIARGEQVTVCPSKKPSTSPACDGVWSDGWVSFVDKNGDGAYDAGSDKIIRVHGATGNGVVMADSGENAFIAFNRMGFARPSFSGRSRTSLAVVACSEDRRAASARAVVVTLSGDVSTAARMPGSGASFQCPQ